MSVWQSAVMDNLYYDHSKPELGDECYVRFEGNLIYVKYDLDGEPQIWRGEELAHGHYELKLMDGNGHARLHRFPDANVLVGEWVEDGEKGAWRVRLDD
jgi:hypothetical protein